MKPFLSYQLIKIISNKAFLRKYTSHFLIDYPQVSS